MQTRRRWLFRCFILLHETFGMLVMATCNLDEISERFKRETLDVLDDAINRLENQSADWRQVLKEARDKLPTEVRETISVELNNMIEGALASVGAELRCDGDFIRFRLQDTLIRLRDGLLGGPAPVRVYDPVVCAVVPRAVDRVYVPRRIKRVDLYGYDLDIPQRSGLRLLHEDNGHTTEVTDAMDVPTNYNITINLGENGVQLTPTSKRFVLMQHDKILGTIGIIQSQLPPCRIFELQYIPTTVVFRPVRDRGDRDFYGNGPAVQSWVEVNSRVTRARVALFMDARETGGDHTHARKEEVRDLWLPPPGTRILSILGSPRSSGRYTDEDHRSDPQMPREPDGPVRKFIFYGDTLGNDLDDDISGYTRANIFFNPIRFSLEETDECTPQGHPVNTCDALDTPLARAYCNDYWDRNWDDPNASTSTVFVDPTLQILDGVNESDDAMPMQWPMQ